MPPSHHASGSSSWAVSATARAAPSTAPGTTTTAPALIASSTSCRRAAPLARSRLNSAARRSASSRAPSSSTTRPTIDRLTYSSDSRLPIWPSVCTNSVSAPVSEDCRDSVSGVTTEEVTTPASSSPFSSVALSGATSFACTLLRSSGNSQVTVMLESVIAASRLLSSESPMIIPPSQ